MEINLINQENKMLSKEELVDLITNDVGSFNEELKNRKEKTKNKINYFLYY